MLELVSSISSPPRCFAWFFTSFSAQEKQAYSKGSLSQRMLSAKSTRPRLVLISSSRGLTLGCCCLSCSWIEWIATCIDKLLLLRGKPVALQVWDTAGQERFAALGDMFYRGRHFSFLINPSIAALGSSFLLCPFIFQELIVCCWFLTSHDRIRLKRWSCGRMNFLPALEFKTQKPFPSQSSATSPTKLLCVKLPKRELWSKNPIILHQVLHCANGCIFG